jgi:hypothetical protein
MMLVFFVPRPSPEVGALGQVIHAQVVDLSSLSFFLGERINKSIEDIQPLLLSCPRLLPSAKHLTRGTGPSV